MKGLTERQRQVLQFIHDYRTAHGWPPSYREIAEHLETNTVRNVEQHLFLLRKKGMLTWKDKETLGISNARTLTLTPTGLAELGVAITALPEGVKYYQWVKLGPKVGGWRDITPEVSHPA